MAILEGFPLITQRTPVSDDGTGNSPNQEFDCVPTSILAGLMYLNGVKALDTGQWSPDALLGMAYPEGYTGGTSASAFVKACATYGCTLYPISGTPGQLVQRIHEQLQVGHPCIVTVPDIYVPASYGWTHVLCAWAESPGVITMLDPWPGKPTTKSDAEWIQLLLFNQIWVLERTQKVEDDVTIDLNNPEVARYFELANTDGTQWRCRQTGKIIQFGLLQDYCNNGAKPLCGLSTKRLPLSNEIPIEALPVVGAKYQHLKGKGIVVQFYEAGAYVYDPDHLVDNPPGAGPCYPLKLYDPTNPAGQGPLVTALQQQVNQLQAQIATDTAVNPQAIQELQVKIAQIKAIVS